MWNDISRAPEMSLRKRGPATAGRDVAVCCASEWGESFQCPWRCCSSRQRRLRVRDDHFIPTAVAAAPEMVMVVVVGGDSGGGNGSHRRLFRKRFRAILFIYLYIIIYSFFLFINNKIINNFHCRPLQNNRLSNNTNNVDINDVSWNYIY